METILTFIVLAITGAFIGILSGMLGIGGGTVMVPAFRLLFGMSPLASTATSLFAIVPTSLAGAISHFRNKTCYLSLGLALGIGGALTSPVGVWLSTISEPWMVMAAAALVIGYSAVNMFIKAIRMKPRESQAVAATGSAVLEVDMRAASELRPAEGATAKGGPEAKAGAALSKKQLGLGLAIGIGAGVLSGYVGVGGGFIMIPLMLSLLNIPMKMASGTSLIAVTLLSIPAVIGQALLGNVDYLAGIAVVAGSIPGAIIGSHLVRHVPERALRFIFGGFLIVAAILLVVNEIGLF